MLSCRKSKLAASSKKVDPTLAALFAGSAKPVTAPPKARYSEAPPAKVQKKEESEDEEEDGADPDADLSELDSDELEAFDDEEELEDDSDDDEEDADDDAEEAASEEEEVAPAKVAEAVTNGEASQKERKRKRKQQEENYDLEAKYFQALADEEEKDPKRQKNEKETKDTPMADADDASDAVSVDGDDVPSEEDEPPVHESLAKDPAVTEFEKASRTIFVSNVSSETITSKSAKKQLLDHLSSVLDKKASPPQTITSIRFRSTAFAAAGLPKRAAFIKKEVMNATTHSTNAYVVYSVPTAVRLAVNQLNGTMVLDRHIRVDSVAHPAPVDHRRCVFVGNLGFVDDEIIMTSKVDADGNEVQEKKKRGKVPMDVEEGLWKVFGEKAGKVESVRVPRDPHTRVGKGFAYVQFYVRAFFLSLSIPPTPILTTHLGRKLGRISPPPPREEIPPHAPPHPPRLPLQSPPQDRPGHRSQAGQVQLQRQAHPPPQGKGGRLRPQTHAREPNRRRSRGQVARAHGRAKGADGGADEGEEGQTDGPAVERGEGEA